MVIFINNNDGTDNSKGSKKSIERIRKQEKMSYTISIVQKSDKFLTLLGILIVSLIIVYALFDSKLYFKMFAGTASIAGFLLSILQLYKL